MTMNSFYTVNSGIYIQSENAGILIDGIHEGVAEGCSKMPEKVFEELKNETGLFGKTDGLIFTHLHGDHFDRARTEKILSRKNAPKFLCPMLNSSTLNTLFSGQGVYRAEIKDITVFAIETVHDGEMFGDVPHFSFVIKINEESAFVAGDAVLTESLAQKVKKLCPNGVNISFFNPLQLIEGENERFFEDFRSDRICIYHLPFPEDDAFQYGKTARSIVKNVPAWENAEILKHMSWI